MAQMNAVRVNEGERKPNLSVVDIPTVGPQDVLIKVRAAGLQPGPITMTKAGLLVNLPVTLGHEIAGEVHQVGEQVEKFQVGDRRLILVGRSTKRLEAIRSLTSLKTDIVATDTVSKEGLDNGEVVGKLKGLIPQGADAIIDLLASGTLVSQIIHVLKCNAVLVHLGGSFTHLEIPLILIMEKCWKLVGSRMHSREDAHTILKWLSDGHLQAEELITHRWSLEQIDQAIVQLQERLDPMWVGVINP